jgi:hypothetical protein
MTQVVDLSIARNNRDQVALALREELIQFSDDVVFPAEQYLDQVTQEPTLDDAGEKRLSRMFTLFGVTNMPILEADFDLLVATWLQLSYVSNHLRERANAESSQHATLAKIWHPAYLDYVEALWSGNLAKIREAARSMGIQGGVPEGSRRLWEGPVTPPEGVQG